MRILSRYVLREFLIPFSYCFLGLTSIYLLFESFDIIGALFEKRPPLALVFAYFGGRFALYLEWLLPATFLLATLYTMWQFCRHSELIAMRANGIGFPTIVRPILTVAAIGAILCYLSNEYYAPNAAEYAKTISLNKFEPVKADVKTNIAFDNSLQHRTWLIQEIDFANPTTLTGVKITVRRPDRSKDYEIFSRHVEYLDGAWWFHTPVWSFFDEFDLPVDPPSPHYACSTLRPLFFLTETPKDIVIQNKTVEFHSIRNLRHYLQINPFLTREDRVARKYEIYRRYASPLASVIIALFAIPAGVATGRQSVFKGILTALGLFLGFYILTSASMVLANRMILPPAWAAFLPNIIFLILGGYLFHRQR